MSHGITNFHATRDNGRHMCHPYKYHPRSPHPDCGDTIPKRQELRCPWCPRNPPRARCCVLLHRSGHPDLGDGAHALHVGVRVRQCVSLLLWREQGRLLVRATVAIGLRAAYVPPLQIPPAIAPPGLRGHHSQTSGTAVSMVSPESPAGTQQRAPTPDRISRRLPIQAGGCETLPLHQTTPPHHPSRCGPVRVSPWPSVLVRVVGKRRRGALRPPSGECEG
jgi:hypothetical protein